MKRSLDWGTGVRECVGESDDGNINQMEKANFVFHVAGRGVRGREQTKILQIARSPEGAVYQCLGRLDDFSVNVPLLLWKIVISKMFL